MRHLVSVLFVILLTAPSAFAWHVNTHIQMVRDVMRLMPPELRKTFTDHQKYAEMGIRDPDLLIRDWQNHYYIPSDPSKGGALDRIEKIVKVIRIKFENSTSPDVTKQLCYLAHYIGDLWSPEYLLMKDITAPDKEFIKNYEIIFQWEGYEEPIQDIRAYLENRSRWRWHLENSNDVQTLLYNEAVNDIARIWLTLWEQSGKEVEPQPPQIVVHKKGTLNFNYERLFLEELYYNNSYRGEEDRLERTKLRAMELKRLRENILPSDAQLTARSEIRNTEIMMSKISPELPFSILESSMKTIGDKSFFVARVYNKSDQPIRSIAFVHPGVRGAFSMISNLSPSDVGKVEAVLPANATKQQVQLIFASPEQE